MFATPTPPPALSSYQAYQDLTPAPQAGSNYLLFTANSKTNYKYQPLVLVNGSLQLNASIYNSSNIPTNSGLSATTPVTTECLWQFFEVSPGNYAIANSATGDLLSPTAANSDGKIQVVPGQDADSASIYSITQHQDSDSSWSDTVAIRDITGPGNCFFTTYPDSNGVNKLYENPGDQVGSCQWCLLFL
ncbi:MAG: hypothetical protein IPN76_32440 [Saprospiraceae bacterium]|nr:hypothetical protein [Saprospiraceae bacterium]